MENTKNKNLAEIQSIYEQLPALDRSREIYLFATVFRSELGLSTWDNDRDEAQQLYARNVGEYVNTTIMGLELSGGGSSEEIEDIIVHHINSETQHRWQAYTACIESANKVDEFIELLPLDSSVTCSINEKAEQIRGRWRLFLQDFGVEGSEFNPLIRAEFVSNKTIWDTAKEDIFLRSVLRTGKQHAAA